MSRPIVCAFLAVLALALSGRLFTVLAQTANPQAPWGSIDIGAKGVGWESNSPNPDNGSELLTPLTLSVIPWQGGKIYGQTEYAVGNYTDSAAGTGTETLHLNHFSDTVLGFETNFKSFNLPSLLSVGINIPTGDSAWELQQSQSIIPVEFIDTDYRGRGFGTDLLYGISFQAGSEQYGAAAGYMYTGAFNPYYGQGGATAQQLKLGDSAFLSLNRAVDHGGGQSDIIRFSAFYFLPTSANGSKQLTMGPNLNASYGWSNPKAFSFEAGLQYFMTTQQSIGPNGALGTRFYFNPSYAFGDFVVSAQSKYILANSYPLMSNNSTIDPYYDGGGLLLGLEPSYRLKLDATSALKFMAGYDFVLWRNVDTDLQGGIVNLEYGHWTFETHYEVNL